jgi:protein O-GlcNAc transferase
MASGDGAEAHLQAGMTLRAAGRLAEAEQSFRKAMALGHDSVALQSNLGSVVAELGRVDEAERHYRNAVELQPDSPAIWSNFLFVLNHVPQRSPAEIFVEHRRFGERFSARRDLERHPNEPRGDRRLRLGYCSGDFRRHAVSSFIEAVLSRHDRRQFEVYCYYNNAAPDAVTARLRKCADRWRDIAGLSDEAVRDLIRADGIDVLVDLSGHSARNRLLVFAQKPAPVQVSWLGYLNTTGLAAMDYRLSDVHVSPAVPFDALNSERLVRLPDSQWCYVPGTDAAVGPVPREANGFVTFGAFTNPLKVNQRVIALWAAVLARVPGSRLLVQLRVPSASPTEYVRHFSDFGIPAERLTAVGVQPAESFFLLHNRVDLMLDTFPVTGGTTTCDSLWMGVPVVTLAGATQTSRVGLSLLATVGLSELVARTPEQYIEVAAALAADLPRLAAMRAGLRKRIQQSPLMNAERFTENLEGAFRTMWHSWCDRQ